jgi:hypothetical protein
LADDALAKLIVDANLEKTCAHEKKLEKRCELGEKIPISAGGCLIDTKH